MKALIRRLLMRPRISPARHRAPGTEGYTIAANDLGLYCVPIKAAHRPACQAILRGQVWEPRTIQFICDQAEGDIVHGGTFFGDMLPAFSRAFARVWAFEPNPDSFKCAEITLRLNDLENVVLHKSGMGRSKGTASLTSTRDGQYLGGGSFLEDAPGDICIVAIDDAIPSDRHVGMIHLDVERYEGEALAGALETIKRCRPLLILETAPTDSPAFQAILELGYRPGPSFEGNTVYCP